MLYNEYHEQYALADEVGFDGVMTNEHHSAYWCGKPAVNIDAAILAKVTKTVKIAILGNVFAVNDPIRMAEEVAILDCYSGVPIISGFVRGGAVETLQAGIDPTTNRERVAEAHDFIVKCWTEPGPFRYEGILSIPRGQSLGNAHAEASARYLVFRRRQPGERRVGGPARSPLHELGRCHRSHRMAETDIHRRFW